METTLVRLFLIPGLIIQQNWLRHLPHFPHADSGRASSSGRRGKRESGNHRQTESSGLPRLRRLTKEKASRSQRREIISGDFYEKKHYPYCWEQQHWQHSHLQVLPRNSQVTSNWHVRPFYACLPAQDHPSAILHSVIFTASASAASVTPSGHASIF